MSIVTLQPETKKRKIEAVVETGSQTKSNSSHTPSEPSVKHSQFIAKTPNFSAEEARIREGEIRNIMAYHFHKDRQEVLEHAVPASNSVKKLAQGLAKGINQILNDLLKGELSQERRRKISMHAIQQFEEMRSWLTAKSSDPLHQEHDMGSNIQTMVKFVAYMVKRYVTYYKIRGRLFSPYTDPINGAGLSVIELTRKVQENINGSELGREGEKSRAREEIRRYINAFAVCVAKRQYNDSEVEQALFETIERSLMLYMNQPNRRYVWSMVCNNTIVRALILGNDAVFSSPEMDVTTDDGHCALVTLFVNLSLCSLSQLGFDNTIKYLGDELWRIQAPYDPETASPSPRYFYTKEILVAVDDQFGRHTQCFVAYDNKELEGEEYIIKDCWAHENKDNPDSCDEIQMLRKINRILGKNPGRAKGKYPILVSGGVVNQTIGKGEPVPDTTDVQLETKDPKLLEDNYYRVHKRLVMQPRGYRFRTVESIPELIIVLADAMEAMVTIRKECNIIHRDISPNNILVVVDDDGNLFGLLNDFDCALDLDQATQSQKRANRTGTLPYMSIANLENHDEERTELDDWESLLYIICGSGSYGINRDYYLSDKAKEDLFIGHWYEDTANLGTIGGQKRTDMGTFSSFYGSIVMKFNQAMPKIGLLQKLAGNLYFALFQNEEVEKMGIGYKCGALCKRDKATGDFLYDPIKRRNKDVVGIISDQLLEVMRKAREEAKQYLKGYTVKDD